MQFRLRTPFRLLARRRKTRGYDAPSLRRRKPFRDPKRRFVLFCEGSKTEPAYFNAIRLACSSTMIAVMTHGGVGVPYTIAMRAVQYAREHRLGRHGRDRLNSFEAGDQVWAVFDRDDHPRFKEAVHLCGDHGVHVARSNPCFELWLILHERDYSRPNHRRALQAELNRLRPEYDRHGAKTPDCNNLVLRVRDAERRAERLLINRETAGDPFGNPSTTVGRLTRAIREADQSAHPR